MTPAGVSGVSAGDVLATARAGNWWSSKLPPLLAVGFAQILRRSATPSEALPALAAATVALCAVAWHAHVVNDLCDIEDDARAGKRNRMARTSPLWRGSLLIALPVLGLLVAASSFADAVTPVLVLAANFLVFALYSVPPIRLKKRGWFGAVADASGAHAVPTLFVLSAMPGGWGESGVDWLFATAAIVSAFAVGLRGIIMHQFADRRADEQARLHTVGTTVKVATARGLVRRVLLPVEAMALVVVVGVLVPYAPLLLVAAVLFVAVELLKVRREWTLPQFEPAERSHERYVPLMNNDAYELWLPNVLSLQLAAGTYGFVPVPILQFGLFYAGVWRRVTALGPLTRYDGDSRRNVATKRRSRALRAARRAPAVEGSGNAQTHLPESALLGASILFGSPNWARNGVNVHSLKLMRGLIERGIKVRLLLTEEETDLVRVEEPRLEHPSDVPIDRLPVGRGQGWGAHWGATIRYLESHAPCVYVPTYDWRHACVAPRLSSRVQVVGDVSGGDDLSREQAERLGAYMSAIVSHDETAIASLQNCRPELADKLVLVPFGIGLPDESPPALARRAIGDLLICVSTFDAWETEVLPVVRGIADRGIPVRATLLGSEERPERRSPSVDDAGDNFVRIVEAPVGRSVYTEHSVILAWLTSGHVPAELASAMGCGCIPFVMGGSAADALFRDGENCFVFENGDTHSIIERLLELQFNELLRTSMSESAHRAAYERFFSFETELDQYVALFADIVDSARNGVVSRHNGEILPPPATVSGVDVFPVPLNHRVPGVGRFPGPKDFEDFRRQLAQGRGVRPNGGKV